MIFFKLCGYIETNYESQYSLQELENIFKTFETAENLKYTGKWLKQKLQKHYSDKITITSVNGREDTVSFKDFAHKVLRQNWEQDRSDITNNKQCCINPGA